MRFVDLAECHVVQKQASGLGIPREAGEAFPYARLAKHGEHLTERPLILYRMTNSGCRQGTAFKEPHPDIFADRSASRGGSQAFHVRDWQAHRQDFGPGRCVAGRRRKGLAEETSFRLKPYGCGPFRSTFSCFRYGDRRGHVAVDWRGEVYSLSRWVDVRAKDTRTRLGDPAQLPGAEETKRLLESKIADKLEGFRRDEDEHLRAGLMAPERARRALVMNQRQARAVLSARQDERATAERATRAALLPRGLRALWYRITRKYAALKEEIKAEAQSCTVRDRRENQQLIDRQLSDRRSLREQEKALRADHEEQVRKLVHDLKEYREPVKPPEPGPHSTERRQQRQRQR